MGQEKGWTIHVRCRFQNRVRRNLRAAVTNTNSEFTRLNDEGFDHLCRGNYSDALSCLQRASELREGFLANLAIAKMCLRDFASAEADFEREALSGHSSSMFNFLGCCRWCRGNETGAIEAWKGGFNRMYSDAAGGVESPLLCLFAALARDDVSLRDKMIEMLHALMSDNPRSENWPAHVAKLALGQMTPREVKICIRHMGVPLQKRRLRTLEFYANAFNNDVARWSTVMKGVERKLRRFVSREWFLARLEYERFR